MQASDQMGMKRHRDAKMVDIRIVEVPSQWKGLAPDREVASEGNTRFIKLEHVPSGTKYSVEVGAEIQDREGVARSRAEAKLAFIRALRGDT
jgi:hypothetical protein